MRLFTATALVALLALSGPPAFAQSYEEGLSATQRGDFATALQHFEPLAEQGDAEAQYLLGLMYTEGLGVAQNYSEAVGWYRRAAEQGLAEAQYNLGVMYANGEGEGESNARDDAEAVAWYQRAAKQGLAEAQYNLGVMYTNGRGVTQNYSEAVKWYRRAAEQGLAGAQNDLGFMYSKGWGVSRNPVITYMLQNLAAAQGNEIARKNRDLILKSLTTEQITEGQRLASEWQVGTPLPTSSDVTTWP